VSEERLDLNKDQSPVPPLGSSPTVHNLNKVVVLCIFLPLASNPNPPYLPPSTCNYEQRNWMRGPGKLGNRSLAFESAYDEHEAFRIATQKLNGLGCHFLEARLSLGTQVTVLVVGHVARGEET
jgi:hypothetical protein